MKLQLNYLKLLIIEFNPSDIYIYIYIYREREREREREKNVKNLIFL